MARLQILTNQEGDELEKQSREDGPDLTVLMRDRRDECSVNSTVDQQLPGKRKAPGLESSSEGGDSAMWTPSRFDTCDEHGTYTTATKRRMLQPGSTVHPRVALAPTKTAAVPTVFTSPWQRDQVIEEGEEQGDVEKDETGCISSQATQTNIMSGLSDLARAFERQYRPSQSASCASAMELTLEHAQTLVT